MFTPTRPTHTFKVVSSDVLEDKVALNSERTHRGGGGDIEDCMLLTATSTSLTTPGGCHARQKEHTWVLCVQDEKSG